MSGVGWSTLHSLPSDSAACLTAQQAPGSMSFPMVPSDYSIGNTHWCLLLSPTDPVPPHLRSWAQLYSPKNTPKHCTINHLFLGLILAFDNTFPPYGIKEVRELMGCVEGGG